MDSLKRFLENTLKQKKGVSDQAILEDDWFDDRYERGWNACIDEITGETEQKEAE